MLYQFLATIQKGGFQSHLELARQMGISPLMVLQMAQELVRHGYLEETGGSCQAEVEQPACSGCAVSAVCQTSFHLWSLTGKGRQALEDRA